ncbi:hypothetical protein K470DRAFT_262267 [Piedraia hortae CBS 480.64]|uniref:LDB19 N-terminal domain-containing protein n=1 Tax=Piedraia hortae CBS 480.64 TaxID=1314780 RepID=A0A6A7C7C4_9PEZI|nr:hypothetical protein K470DRAFT_262267 [Piedraia hortae CBS 480.64]
MDHFRLPFLRRHSGEQRAQSTGPVKMDMVIESPPVMFLGTPSESTGALMSGRLQLWPKEGAVVMTSIVMFLECTTKTGCPSNTKCKECKTDVRDLYEWNFFYKPHSFEPSEHPCELPFSHLIPGHLPSTTLGSLCSIEYSLHVRARSDNNVESEFRRELEISRALRANGERTYIRVFPPSDLQMHVTLPLAVYQFGEFEMKIIIKNVKEKKDTRWELRKLHWRVEEHEVMSHIGCEKHRVAHESESRAEVGEAAHSSSEAVHRLMEAADSSGETAQTTTHSTAPSTAPDTAQGIPQSSREAVERSRVAAHSSSLRAALTSYTEQMSAVVASVKHSASGLSTPAKPGQSGTATPKRPKSPTTHHRLVGWGEWKEGWKNNHEDEQIELETRISLNPSLHALCDVRSDDGFKLWHVLTLEGFVAEERRSKTKPNKSTPTGLARSMTARFDLIVTKRAGMGIAWNDEAPPTYDNVPESPPVYEGTSTSYREPEDARD